MVLIRQHIDVSSAKKLWAYEGDVVHCALGPILDFKILMWGHLNFWGDKDSPILWAHALMLIPYTNHIWFSALKKNFWWFLPIFWPILAFFGFWPNFKIPNLYCYESQIPRTFLVVLISQHTDVSSAKNDGPMRGGFLGNRSWTFFAILANVQFLRFPCGSNLTSMPFF